MRFSFLLVCLLFALLLFVCLFFSLLFFFPIKPGENANANGSVTEAECIELWMYLGTDVFKGPRFAKKKTLP